MFRKVYIVRLSLCCSFYGRFCYILLILSSISVCACERTCFVFCCSSSVNTSLWTGHHPNRCIHFVEMPIIYTVNNCLALLFLFALQICTHIRLLFWLPWLFARFTAKWCVIVCYWMIWCVRARAMCPPLQRLNQDYAKRENHCLL